MDVTEQSLIKHLNLLDLTNEDSSFAPFSMENNEPDSLHPSVQGQSIVQHGGVCLKEFEEQLQSLKKENFNLKLRIYFLEEKNPNVPADAETLYKQNIDLKVENESLVKDTQEKQDLLCQASRALELLDEQRKKEQSHSMMAVDEMQHRIEVLQNEVDSLHQALSEQANKTNLGNNIGYTEFIGAVDAKDVEYHRKLLELSQIEDNYNREMSEMRAQLIDLKQQNNQFETNVASMQFGNMELQDKLNHLEKSHTNNNINEILSDENELLRNKCDELEYSLTELSICIRDEPTAKLEKDLHEYKDKWATTQCDLQDAQEKYEDSETERKKTLKVLQEALDTLKVERQKIKVFENLIAEQGAAAVTQEGARRESMTDTQKMLEMKDNQIEILKSEIQKLKIETGKLTQKLKRLTSEDIHEKNDEIERLTKTISNLQFHQGGNTNADASHMSLEKLSESLNDLKYQQALEEKKISQHKIDELVQQLTDVTSARAHEHVIELKKQMKIVAQKQEVTDTALNKCAELCAFTLEHLHELANFLNSLIQQKEIRESLSESALSSIQNVIEKSMELSQHAGRISFSDSRFSFLPDLSSLDLLMTTARNSIATFKDVQSCMNKSVQASNIQEIENIFSELTEAKIELEDIKRVNQVLEDEICQFKELMHDYKLKLNSRDDEFDELKEQKDSLNKQLMLVESELKNISHQCDQLELSLQNETIKKLGFEARAQKSETLAEKLEDRLQTFQQDLEVNWITRDEHQKKIRMLEEDITIGHAQLEVIREELAQLRTSISGEAIGGAETNKENDEVKPPLKMLEISEERKRMLLMSEEEPSSSVVLLDGELSSDCKMCPNYQLENTKLKKHLQLALQKLRQHSEQKSKTDQHIKKQLSKTESFLSQARSNMENILKARCENQQ